MTFNYFLLFFVFIGYCGAVCCAYFQGGKVAISKRLREVDGGARFLEVNVWVGEAYSGFRFAAEWKTVS